MKRFLDSGGTVRERVMGDQKVRQDISTYTTRLICKCVVDSHIPLYRPQLIDISAAVIALPKYHE